MGEETLNRRLRVEYCVEYSQRLAPHALRRRGDHVHDSAAERDSASRAQGMAVVDARRAHAAVARGGQAHHVLHSEGLVGSTHPGRRARERDGVLRGMVPDSTAGVWCWGWWSGCVRVVWRAPSPALRIHCRGWMDSYSSRRTWRERRSERDAVRRWSPSAVSVARRWL